MPQTFTDKLDREWSIRVNVGVMRRARAKGVDLSMPVQQLGQYLFDDCFMVDCLWSIVEQQAKERTISQEAFEEALDGKIIAAAREQLWLVLEEYYDDPKAEMLRQSLDAAKVEMGKIARSIGSSISAKSKANSATE